MPPPVLMHTLKWRRVVLALAGIALLAVLGLVVVGPSRACESVGGKPGGPFLCTTRACYWLGNCGKWAYPQTECSRLTEGDAKAEVYFRLGTPDEVFPGGAKWQAAKDSTELIVAKFREEKLHSLSCPAPQ
jgi:hypothetical protein